MLLPSLHLLIFFYDSICRNAGYASHQVRIRTGHVLLLDQRKCGEHIVENFFVFADYDMQGKDFTAHEAPPFMLAHVHNRGLLLRPALVVLYK